MNEYKQNDLPFILSVLQCFKFAGAFFLWKVKYCLKKDREGLIIQKNILWKKIIYVKC